MNDKEDISIRKQIIEYWDGAGLCSFDSSTSHANSHIASCDNFIEARLLEELIDNHNKSILGLDIGAGLGRFTVVMAHHLNFVHALEPSKNLCHKLKDNCSDFDNIEVFNSDFESFDIQDNYDISIVSGLLYLYPNEMVHSFLKKLVESLNVGGIIIIRDFVIESGVEQIPSTYVEDRFCYYRDTQYWMDVTQEYNLKLLSIFQSRPSYKFKKLLWLCGKLRLMKIFRTDVIKIRLYKDVILKKEKGILSFNGSEIKTVFMVMKKR